MGELTERYEEIREMLQDPVGRRYLKRLVPLVVLSVAALSVASVFLFRSQNNYDSAYRTVSRMIHPDTTSTPTMHEWADVYESLNKPFNPNHPRRLLRSDLERFIEISQDSSSLVRNIDDIY